MSTPLFLSPALPSELLTYILKYHTHPTTLVICASRADFLSSVAKDIRQQEKATTPTLEDEQQPPSTAHRDHHEGEEPVLQLKHHALLSSPLHQVATARHIRIVYVPTVTHLQAYLSVFTPDDSKVPAPPSHHRQTPSTSRNPHIILYGFLDLHRATSEWSAQGLGSSAAAVVDLAHRLAWQALVVEPRTGGGVGAANVQPRLEDVLRETVPMLGGGARRAALDADGGGAWTGRTVEVGRILRRWFRLQRGVWDGDGDPEEAGGVGKV
ncbi:Uu.00g052210.m01.CDS01 [Anthostomella pinea]|uniref:Uu.00g052210.m01.CDS01 n=1 Tax=Anthostomella pinea TaxID=933095 RepID=A0AAI8VQI3_9PEZI|nr:Uu.00g052210.m01.CDS01 [Anthostomella pinea]